MWICERVNGRACNANAYAYRHFAVVVITPVRPLARPLSEGKGKERRHPPGPIQCFGLPATHLKGEMCSQAHVNSVDRCYSSRAASYAFRGAGAPELGGGGGHLSTSSATLWQFRSRYWARYSFMWPRATARCCGWQHVPLVLHKCCPAEYDMVINSQDQHQ